MLQHIKCTCNRSVTVLLDSVIHSKITHDLTRSSYSLQQFKSEFCPTPEAATVHKDVVSVINGEKKKRETDIYRGMVLNLKAR